ncbi:EAL domain-containing protein [Pseudomonas sp. DTU_2021_1001937_2_SI_NGA_ILE_001]|uniref:sensor domain-containing protein n=1 Tax=Pseudomonas sp. DTU_2021_1001937_2_SI_NGA_ILE_001 TaxID=3077589 RepID=UPI0028FC0E89|nr:EAL domain-containing protein [Pseudomonas sp. DTU_2021_1001937_2_SI_NGA_ILE_001]WNW10601.1 EAL domain-containing protein [Pseudomonas sp. DTU_2021_1001937_2_SI_NGA_ILE_001]
MTLVVENPDVMYRLLVQGVVDYAIYMLTPEGIVANWNSGAERAKQYRAQEIVGKHFSLFYSAEERARNVPMAGLETARRTGRFEAEGWRVRKDGSTFWAHVVIDAIRGDHGELIGFAKITRDCTLQRQALLAQREQEQRFRLLVQGATDYAIYMLDLDGHVVNWNSGAERAKGYRAEEIVGRHFSVFYTPDDRARGLPQHGLDTARRDGRFEAEGVRLRKNGTHFWTHVVITPMHDDDGQPIGFSKITRDITERREAELQVLAAKDMAERYSEQMAALSRFLDSVIGSIPASVLVQDARSREILLVNEQAQRLFGATRQGMLGKQARDCLSATMADYVEEQTEHCLRSAHVRQSEQRLRTAIGLRVLRTKTLLRSDVEAQSNYVLLIAEDVTDEIAAREQIHHMAHHDALTGLANRTLLHEQLQQALDTCALQPRLIATLCLDLDKFKNVNDAFGHAFGDTLLRAVAERLRGVLDEHDTLARLGGDEFAIVLSRVERPKDAYRIAQRITACMAAPFLMEGHNLLIGVSIGIAFNQTPGESGELLLGHADMALYEAKRNGRNRYEVFHPAMAEAAQHRRLMEIELRKALHQGHLQLYYQPIIGLDEPRITGYEALMRWHHPTRGLIMPLDFIPIAEETGLIHEVGARALNLACQEACNWSGEQSVAVNLSPVQFKNCELVDIVRLALTDSGLAPHRLELEITESVLLENDEENLATLRELKALGVAIALDDFGTGYSSLGYLRSFPFDRIKIDRSFVNEMAESREAMAVIRAITGISTSLLIKTTAEGVETQEQYELLKAEGCSHLQGYLFGRPSPTHERKERI